MIRKILLAIGVVGLVFIGTHIDKAFWGETRYIDQVNEIQMNGSYLPYRARKILFNKYVAIIKTEVERSLNWLWFDKFWGILSLGVLIAFFKKRWIEMGMIIAGVALVVVESNPNPGYYFWFLMPQICSIFF